MESENSNFQCTGLMMRDLGSADIYDMTSEGAVKPSPCECASKSCDSTASVGGGAAAGFVGGVLLAAVMAAVIFVVFAQRLRSVHMKILVVHCYWSCFL